MHTKIQDSLPPREATKSMKPGYVFSVSSLNQRLRLKYKTQFS
jgi:hypothetical protein